MVDIHYSIIGERLKKALEELAPINDEKYVHLKKNTCEQLYEAYKTTPIVYVTVNKLGTRPKIGKEEMTGVKDETDESDREEVVLEYHVNRAAIDEILNEALLLGCDWAQEILKEILSRESFQHTRTPIKSKDRLEY